MKKVLSIGVFIAALILPAIYLFKPVDKTTPPALALAIAPTQEKMKNVLTIYHDGVYTGNAVSTQYGIMQVSVTIHEKKVSDITFLQLPGANAASQQISAQASVLLKKEALSTQCGRIDTISGATATTGAFISSLYSGLSQAQTG